MNIVHVNYSLNTGGTELMLVDILHEQVKSGNNVSLIIINDSMEQAIVDQIPKEVKFVKIGRPEGSKNPWWIIKYNIILKRLNPDIVHMHLDNCMSITRKQKGVKYVETVHTTGTSTRNFNKFDRIFAISKGVASDVKRLCGVDPIVVYNGIKPQLIALRDKQDINGRPFKILQVGRLFHEVKGQDILIQATARLINMGKQIELEFIGDGASRQMLKNLADSQGIKNHVTFRGLKGRDYIYPHLKDFDLFVQPSRIEGFGLTVAEGMIARLPVLISDLDGPMELINNGEYGSFFMCDDIDSCAESLKEIIDNYDKYQQLANTEAWEYARNNFDISATTEKYLEQYNLLLKI